MTPPLPPSGMMWDYPTDNCIVDQRRTHVNDTRGQEGGPAISERETFLDALVRSISAAASYHPLDQDAPAAILWPDGEREWETHDPCRARWQARIRCALSQWAHGLP